ncbi:MAG: hypothetical protein LC131_18050 [Anaerolineae bacterium]|nr:hypothetical protein [Anaerolineae bacterium]
MNDSAVFDQPVFYYPGRISDPKALFQFAQPMLHVMPGGEKLSGLAARIKVE